MKRFLSFLTLAVMVCTAVSAQNTPYRAIIGLHHDANGAVVMSDPTTTIVVDLTIEKEQTIVGPYARYAQKYLDVRGSLVEKTTYALKSAQVSIATDDAVFALKPIAPESVSVQSHLSSATEFAKVLPDRMTLSPMSAEDAAAQAAQAIFTLRRKRVELITGDAGENVFGAGLKDALDALDAREQAYLELFLGKKVTTTYTERVVLPLNGTTTSYTIAKLSSSTGLQSATASEGEDIKLNITPSGVSPKLATIPEADPRDKTALQVRLADNATCVISVGGAAVGSATLPIFEFGRTVNITNTLAVKR